MIVWFLFRSAFQYLYLTFYQIRRLTGIAIGRELVPLVLGVVAFAILLKHPKITPFFEEVVAEIKKVTWPGRPDVVRSTTVVVVCILIASLLLAAFDLIWGKMIGALLKT